MNTTATTTTTTATTTATAAITPDNASVPDVTLVITTATTTAASVPDILSPDIIGDGKVLYAPAITPVRWLRTISDKMGTTLRLSQDKAEVLRAGASTPGYEALLNRTGVEERILKALGAITPEEQELLKKTLVVTVEGRSRNTPMFQLIKIRYFTNVQSWIQDREPKGISLQDLLNKIGLSSLYSEIGLGLFEDTFPDDRYQHWDWDSVEFHRINGKGRGEDIANVYTNVDPYDERYVDTYPSPWGSCMRCSEWTYNGYSLGYGYSCNYDHPVVAYATEDIDLAWVTDLNGKTLARCLINNRTRTVSRVYAIGLNLATYDYQKRSQKELKDKLLEFVGLPVDEHTGLKGCRFAPQFLDEGTIVAPYIDGSYYVYDSDTGIIGDTGEFTCTEHNPPVVCRDGKKYTCGQCGNRCDEDDVYFDGEWWCRYCVDEHLSYCVSCDEYCYTSDSTYCDETGEWYCDSCAESRLIRCDHCDEWFLNRSVIFCSSDGHNYCESCMEDKDIYRCDSCDEYYFADELNEDICCHCCAAEAEAVDNESEDTNE